MVNSSLICLLPSIRLPFLTLSLGLESGNALRTIVMVFSRISRVKSLQSSLLGYSSGKCLRSNGKATDCQIQINILHPLAVRHSNDFNDLSLVSLSVRLFFFRGIFTLFFNENPLQMMLSIIRKYICSSAKKADVCSPARQTLILRAVTQLVNGLHDINKLAINFAGIESHFSPDVRVDCQTNFVEEYKIPFPFESLFKLNA